ncbi:sensor domain-containing diguanylate cyclase [Comamonas sp. GB3 AK4-5]|uniref:sensor domain-containing diguanylate cyclase n=1 Tax=Comamonas sp. GB3 AK4-5 TaxID=3231487 RepID=UPI00351E7501
MSPDASALPLPRSLRTPLAWGAGVLAAVLTLLLWLAFAELQKNRLAREAGQALQVLANSGAQQLADELFARSQLVQVLAQSPDLWHEGLETPAVQALVTRIPLIRPYTAWVGVADAQGRVVQASGDLLEGRSVANAPWFTAGSQAVYVSDVLPAKLLAPLLPASASGEPPLLVSFSAPIQAGGALLGVLGLHTHWDWARSTLQTLRATLTPDSQVALFIFDRHGRMLYAPADQLTATPVDGPAFLPKTAPPQAPQPPCRMLRWSDSSTPFLTAVAALPSRSATSDQGWYVVARQPVAAASATTPSLLQAGAAALALALLAAALLWWLSRRTVHGLHSLTQAALQFNAGNPPAAFPQLHSSRELQQLSHALRGMAQGQQEGPEPKKGLWDQQAETDPLTGLLNRRGFGAQLQFATALARRSGRPLCLMALDIDGFTQRSPPLPPEAHGQILQDLARHLRARLRDSDRVARWGETEFMVLLPDTPAEDVQRMALDILATVEQHRWPQGGAPTLSAGITALHPTLHNGTEDTEAALLQRCDEALQQSRKIGGNQVHFQP